MTGTTGPTQAIIGVLGRAYAQGASPSWTAHAILTALRGLGWIDLGGVTGYRIDDFVFHPADVEIIIREDT